jgi:uncharacterized membrane protein
LKEKEREPVSEVPQEDCDPSGGNDKPAGAANREEAVIIPAQVIDDEVDRFIKTQIPELKAEREERHELDHVVHGLLLGGLLLSTSFIVFGLLLSSLYHRQLPSAASSLKQVLQDTKAGAPSGFLNLGILFLIATPIIRVLGSLVEFVYRHDWRYTIVTSIVLLILAISVMLGRG